MFWESGTTSSSDAMLKPLRWMAVISAELRGSLIKGIVFPRTLLTDPSVPPDAAAETLKRAWRRLISSAWYKQSWRIFFFYDFGSATPVVVAMFPKLSRREYLVFKLQTLWKGDRCGRLNALTVKLCQLDKQSLQPRAFVRASLSRWSICSSWEA